MNKGVLAFALSFMFMTSAFSQSIIDRVMDKQAYTFSPDVQVSGPIYSSENQREYLKDTLMIILSEAHELAQEYIEVKDSFAYWSFMMGAIMVPLHEGGFMQFRKVPNSKNSCLQLRNSGNHFAKGSSYKRVFKSYFKTKFDPIFPDCKDLKDENELIQVMAGADGSDITMMQINMKYHELGFIMFGGYQDTRSTVQYGLKMYKKGFDYVYRNHKKFPCVKVGKKINQKKLIHAAWSGYYNSGDFNESCRWTRDDNQWQANDDAYIINLTKLYGFIDIKKIMNSFPFPKDEARLLSAIIDTGSIAREEKPDLITNYINSQIVPAAADEDLAESNVYPRQAEAIVELNVRMAIPNGSVMAPTTGKILKTHEQITVTAEVKMGAYTWYKISSPYEGWISGYYVRFK